MEDKEAIFSFHNCPQQEKERRRVILESATRILQQSSWELVLACMTCVLVVTGSVLLITVTVTLLEARDGSPLVLPRHGQQPAPHLSFVSLGEDCDHSALCRCAVATAARLNPHIPCHVYNIVDRKVPLLSDLASLPNVHLHYNTSLCYFGHSPLDSWWAGAPRRLAAFAARVLALWRHGGTSLDAGLVALGGTIVGNLSGNAMFLEAEEGKVLAASSPCHAFLFELMRALKRASTTATIRDVIADTLSQFCVTGGGALCPGVSIIPRDMFCAFEADLGKPSFKVTSKEDKSLSDMNHEKSRKLPADIFVVVGIINVKNSSTHDQRHELLVERTAHVIRRKHQACSWATLNDDLLEEMCPVQPS